MRDVLERVERRGRLRDQDRLAIARQDRRDLKLALSWGPEDQAVVLGRDPVVEDAEQWFCGGVERGAAYEEDDRASAPLKPVDAPGSVDLSLRADRPGYPACALLRQRGAMCVGLAITMDVDAAILS